MAEFLVPRARALLRAYAPEAADVRMDASTPEGTLSLLERLEEATGEDILLFDDAGKAPALVHVREHECDSACFFFPVAGVGNLRPEAAALAHRFLRCFFRHQEIPSLTDQVVFEMLRDGNEMELHDSETDGDDPERIASLRAVHEDFTDYESGKRAALLASFVLGRDGFDAELAALKADAAAFVPSGKCEDRLAELVRVGTAIMDDGDRLWEHYWSSTEMCERFGCDDYLFYDYYTAFIGSPDDPLAEDLFGYVDSEIQCGLVPEPICSVETVQPDKATSFVPDTDKVGRLVRFYDALADFLVFLAGKPKES